MKTVKVYVNQDRHAGITCPNCQKTFEIPVEKYKESKHSLVTKCACKEQFIVELNFRQFYRKDVKLIGEFINISKGSNNWYTVTVTNLSLIGLRFKAIGSINIENGNTLKVKFTLDNQKFTALEKEVIVININKDHYGCKFVNKDYEKELGFYLRT